MTRVHSAVSDLPNAATRGINFFRTKYSLFCINTSCRSLNGDLSSTFSHCLFGFLPRDPEVAAVKKIIRSKLKEVSENLYVEFRAVTSGDYGALSCLTMPWLVIPL